MVWWPPCSRRLESWFQPCRTRAHGVGQPPPHATRSKGSLWPGTEADQAAPVYSPDTRRVGGWVEEGRPATGIAGILHRDLASVARRVKALAIGRTPAAAGRPPVWTFAQIDRLVAVATEMLQGAECNGCCGAQPLRARWMGTCAAPVRPCTPRVGKCCARARAGGAQQGRDLGSRAMYEPRAPHRFKRVPRSSFPRAQHAADTDHRTKVVCSLWAYMMAGSAARVAPWRGVCPRTTQNKITDTVWTWRERGGAEEGTCKPCAEGPFRRPRVRLLGCVRLPTFL
eukprot:11228292-Lingulodinium_polyedra.AAC.1